MIDWQRLQDRPADCNIQGPQGHIGPFREQRGARAGREPALAAATLHHQPGATGAPYEGGVWKVRVDLPDKYPFKSPSIGTTRFQYNVLVERGRKYLSHSLVTSLTDAGVMEALGELCPVIFSEKLCQIGRRLVNLTNIFESFLPQLLAYPNPIDPLNGDAAAMYLHRPEEYKQKIKEYIQKYATEEALKEQEEGTGDSSSESSMSDFSEDEAQDMEL
ncbi:Ubiquitin-conjugating enzyme E2 H [Chelonia mydas]|uniref:Ubiquitin-conjugating enzyme E2 H n=1 Tax=Chelonia mydas TaxID=8469 RepID=M7APS3_CHEMY|nr:Ubiquitin-conjugating enzyme E2 H [Chelonia mydas]